MIGIVGYLVLWLAASVFLMVWQEFIALPQWYLNHLLMAQCTLIGIIGGLMYCLRSVYLHKCKLKDWDERWEIWYYLRPIASAISGFVSFIFLKAGLLVLDVTSDTSKITFGYLAIAFIAGYNVENFMRKIEEVACSVWGIEKSGILRGLENMPEKEGKNKRDE
jgi:hypothetical protein